MNLSSILVLICGVALFLTYALWDLGADHLVASIGRWILRVVTLGRVQIPDEEFDSSGVLAAGAATVIFVVLIFVIATAWLG